MSYRGEPRDLIQLVQNMNDRLTALERDRAATKQNNVRLGDWVLETEEDKRVRMTNLRTKEVTYIGDQYIPFVNSKEWSYAGVVAPDADILAPKLVTPIDLTLTHVIVSLQTASTSDYTIGTVIEGSTVSTHTLAAGNTKVTWKVSIDVPQDAALYPRITANAAGDGTELSVVYWYTGVYQGEW